VNASSFRVLAVVAALVLGSSPAMAQMLRGTVLDSSSGKPVGGAQVVVFSAAGVRMGDAVTLADGQFTFHLPAAGEYRLRASRLGYETTITETIAVASTSESIVSLLLAPRPLSLDTLTVVAPGAAHRLPSLEEVGFYRRQRTLVGYFLTRAQIEKYSKYSHYYMTDVLRHLARVQVVCNKWLSCDVGMGRCPPSVILDGKVVRIGGDLYGPWDSTLPEWLKPVPVTVDELLKPSNIEALEVYPDAVHLPIQWGGFISPCGAIVAWTRR
jgi:carboxypeptidase family protein